MAINRDYSQVYFVWFRGGMEAIPYTNSEVNTLHLSDNQPTEVLYLELL